jgi:GNAT superfamily N-acetyltransferase
MEIRVVTTRADAEAAHVLVTRMCVDSGYKDRPDLNAFVEMLLQNPESIAVLLAFENGQAVGTATVSQMLSVYKPGPCGVYRALYVPPEHRRKGVAEKLFAGIRAETKRRGWKGLWWTVYQQNTPSLEFFGNNGLKPNGAFEEFWLSESEL